jgi:hypothetical protein
MNEHKPAEQAATHGAGTSPNSGLTVVTYSDIDKGIHLKNYADTIVYDTANGRKMLCAIRFGGYPEQVDGMAQAIYGGGDITAEIGGKIIVLKPFMKQYSRKISHDGVYAEATLIAEDENRQALAKPDDQNGEDDNYDSPDNPNADLPPRSSYIYTAPGDQEALYGAIDRKTGAPMIPEFADYIVSALKLEGILKPLAVMSSSLKFDAWVLRCDSGDRNIIDVVEKGIKNGEIAIPCAASGGAGAFEAVNSVTEYLCAFGKSVAERIKSLFVPLFDPEKDSLSPEISDINGTIQEKAGYSLYDAQLAVAESIKRQLSRDKAGLVIAECGAGKTKIGAAAIAACIAGMQASRNGLAKGKTFNIVLCPSHIKEKWVREIEETLPDTFACIVNSITELDKLYTTFAKGGKHCYAIISKEMARDGYMHRPAVVWSKLKKAFICPDCWSVVEMAISKDGSRYIVDADQFYFKRQNRENHKCKKCGSPLWTTLNPTATSRSGWYKLGNYGFIFQPTASEHIRKVDSSSFRQKITQLIEQPSSVPPAVGAHRKYPLSTYVKKRYRGRIDGVIVDELHQYNNDSGQGDAMAELYGTAKKVVGLTGTLVNGYASGIFHLLFRLMPKAMLEDGQSHSSPMDFAAEYGVIENTYEVNEGDYNANRRSVRRKKSSRQLPGVSPLVYSRFLLEHAAFLSLSDMGKDLPDYEEIPVPVHMPPDVSKPYFNMHDNLKNFMKDDRKSAKRIMSAYLNLLTAYPDQPYGQPPIIHPVSGSVIVEPPDTADFDTILPKDKAALDIVKRKVGAGERVLIYTNWTRLDTQRKLLKLATEAGYHAEILPSTVKPEKRERWVDDCVARGAQVLITNPALVETGLDLIPFTTLIFYDTGYKLFTLRQASRRSWRINQTYPRIEVYMIYYTNTMQHKAMKLMASKLAVAGIIEGGFSEEGLAAMSQCDDMTSQMAKELMLGIKDNVEDVSAAFKRMSVTKRQGYPLAIFTDEKVKIGSAKHGGSQIVEFTFEAQNKTGQAPVADIVNLFAHTADTAAAPAAFGETQLSLFENIA